MQGETRTEKLEVAMGREKADILTRPGTSRPLETNLDNFFLHLLFTFSALLGEGRLWIQSFGFWSFVM